MKNKTIIATYEGKQYTYELNKFYYDIPEKMYHGLEYPGLLSSSTSKRITKSLESFFRSDFKKTSAMELGTLFHSYVQGAEVFGRDYIEVDVKSKNNSIYKDAVKANPDAVVVKESDMILVKTIYKNLRNHPQFRDICEDKRLANEVTVFYEYQGRVFKSRFDRLCLDKHYIIDWKTTKDASSTYMLAKTGKQLGYDVQAVLYKYAYKQVTGVDPEHYLVWVENNNLCLPRFTQLSKRELDAATIKLDMALMKLSSFEANPNTYTGYSPDVEELPFLEYDD